ncbi:hypothetical protein VKT23_008927 [Stygiomarasmius scandens]|uniref:Uncharacterized protein n=1 Tax=Marasmiellus scandens TaxID=2682957 RepID=A0ABR1JH25_9AGAR
MSFTPSYNVSPSELNPVVEDIARRLHRYQYIFDTLRAGIMSNGEGYGKNDAYRRIIESLECPSPKDLTEKMKEDKERQMMSMLEEKCRKEIVSLEDRLDVISAAFTLSNHVISVEMKRLSKDDQDAVMRRYNELYKQTSSPGTLSTSLELPFSQSRVWMVCF